MKEQNEMNKTSRTNSEQSVTMAIQVSTSNSADHKISSTPEHMSPSPSSSNFLRSSTSSQASDDSHSLSTNSDAYVNSKEAEEFMQQSMRSYEQKLNSATLRRGGEVQKRYFYESKN